MEPFFLKTPKRTKDGSAASSGERRQVKILDREKDKRMKKTCSQKKERVPTEMWIYLGRLSSSGASE